MSTQITTGFTVREPVVKPIPPRGGLQTTWHQYGFSEGYKEALLHVAGLIAGPDSNPDTASAVERLNAIREHIEQNSGVVFQ